MCLLENLAGITIDDPVPRGARPPPPQPGDATISSVGPPPKRHRRPESASNNFPKTNTTAPAGGAAPHRRLAQVEQIDRCYCRRSASRARVRAEIKVNGASFLLIAQSESPARAKPGVLCACWRIWRALPSMTRYLAALGRRRPNQAMPPSAASVHRPSAIVAPNPPAIISLKRTRRRRPAAQHHTAGSRRSSRSIAVIAAALPRARA